MSRRAIYVGGVKGVGKTALLEALTATMPYQLVDVTIWMMEYLAQERDALDRMTVESRAAAREYAFQRAFADADPGSLIFDSHFVIPSPHGHEWGLPWSFVPQLGPFVLVTAQPEHVLARRTADTNRRRARLTLPEVLLDSQVEEAYGAYLSKTTGQRLFYVDNASSFEAGETALASTLEAIQHDRGY